ncbi:MAG: type II secretion system F family protein [Candidatus Hydrogenedentes bacterium]|nr:type II secretion system F family protein [Candidatus Hydrogenedentota bacterium]
MPTPADRPAEAIKRVRRGAKKIASVSTTAPVEEAVAPRPLAMTSAALFVGVRSRDVTTFLRQLIMLVEAGTPILKALRTLAERGQRASIRHLVADIAQYVEAGNPLWQAFDRHPRQFSPVFVNLIKASEASGTLTTVLERIVTYRERRQILVKRVAGAMFYPVLLLVACFFVVWVITRWVIPQFEEIFQRLNVPLGGYTKGFIATTTFIGDFYWAIILVIVALVALYQLAVRSSPMWRLRADRIKLSIPIVGPIATGYAIVDFTRYLALLLRSGLSMMVTLDLVRNAINNRAVARVLDGVRDAVERGEGLEQPLRNAHRIIPPVVTDMLVTGEESGQLDKIAEQIADTYEEEVNIRISTLGDALVPVVTIFIGVIVILLAMAVFRPMIDMIGQLQGEAGG